MIRRGPDRDHAPGEWECGSGRVEYGEEPEDAVRREAREETGLDVDVVGPVDTFHYYRGPPARRRSASRSTAAHAAATCVSRTSTTRPSGCHSTVSSTSR